MAKYLFDDDLTDEENAVGYAEAHHPALWEVRSLSDLQQWFEDHKEDIDQGAARGVGFGAASWPFNVSAGVVAQVVWSKIQKRGRG